MATIDAAVVSLTSAGLTTSYTGSLSTSNVYQFDNDGKVFIHLKKSGAGSCTVTVITPATAGRDALGIADATFTLPASTGDIMIGPFEPQIYNNSSGKCQFSLSEITGVTMQVTHM